MKRNPQRFIKNRVKDQVPQKRPITRVVDIHRKNGKRLHFDIYIGRKMRWYRYPMPIELSKDSKWANHSPTLQAYEETIRITDRLWNALDELEGKILGCWCVTTTKTVPLRCHGQVLMKLLKEKQMRK